MKGIYYSHVRLLQNTTPMLQLTTVSLLLTRHVLQRTAFRDLAHGEYSPDK